MGRLHLTPDLLEGAYEYLRLSPPFREWRLPDGDHDLKPRKASGRTLADNLDEATGRVAAWR